MFHSSNRKLTEDAKIGFSSARKLIQRVMNEVNDGKIKGTFSSLDELGQYLKENENALKIITGDQSESKLECHVIKSSSQSSHLVFHSPELTNKFEEYDDLFGDCTYAICPKIPGVGQVLVLLGKKHNVVSNM